MAADLIAKTSSRFRRMCISEPRIYGPRTLDDETPIVPREERDELRSELLGKIESCYAQVKLRGHCIDDGFCFGLLDPVSNIVAGIVIASSVELDPGPVVSLPNKSKPDLIGNMNQQSLNGLVAFLAALFPHLNEAKAMWYLNEADLDPLVAARLLIQHRGMEQSFGFSSDTTIAAVETALRCAAAAAQLPSPKQFASGWKLLSHSLERVAAVLSSVPCVTSSCIAIADILLVKPQPSVFNLEKSWELASSRLLKLSPHPLYACSSSVFLERSTVRRLLLTTIHGYYLQALARLPKERLCSQYHHSLLHAGHCFGPLDPVSNIIFNTIWYSRAYPLAKKVELEAISSKGLLRIAVRSFYGLVSFLCTRSHLSPDEAMQRLQAAGADLRFADPNLLDDFNSDDAMVSAGVEQAFAAAAAAALHPKPHDQARLLRPSSLMMRMASDYLKDGGTLSHVQAHHLAESLLCSISEPEHPETMIKVVSGSIYTSNEQLTSSFWNQHARVVGMVKSLLEEYSQQHGLPKYELHVICGVNERVDGPVFTAPFTGTYRCSHVNFLATQSAGTPPTLFFAECHNDDTQEMGWCCPVGMPPPGTEQVRCLYCEYGGRRIVHPAQGSFHGSGMEFEKMWAGEKLYSHWYNNDGIIRRSIKPTFWVDCLEDDCIYNTYRLDDKHIGVKVFIKKERLDENKRMILINMGLADMMDEGTA